MKQSVHSAIREVSPCYGCTEKFPACHGDCPKDRRGEFGFKAWTAEKDRVKAEREKYLKRKYIRKYW